MPETTLLLRLSRLSQLRPRERIILAHHLETEEAFLAASPSELSFIVGRPVSADPHGPEAVEFDLRRDLRSLEAGEISVCSFFEADYPPRLREIFDPPLLLFLRGHRELLNDDAGVSIVGTRKPTAEAVAETRKLAAAVAQGGYTVVSGLARGIDGAAHRGALGHPGGRTIAVLGSGVDRLYPPQHRPLAREILATGGLIVSEYPPGTEVRKYQFPERNRIIAGLTSLLWVVQAPEGSGALITADFALQENRDVVVHATGAAPGERNQGSRALAEDGAKVYESWERFVKQEIWPPRAAEEPTVAETLEEWTGRTRRKNSRRSVGVRKHTEEMISGQELLALFSGDRSAQGEES